MIKKENITRFLPDGFIVGIGTMIALAWFFPGIGGEGSAWSLKTVNHWGVVALFFFYGLRLSPEKMKNDLKNWKLHVTVQTLTFLVFPLLVLPFYWVFRTTDYLQLWLAVFFLACLPSTVSSSVVMVSIARGNIAGAIFNASISGIIGIVLTPLWLGFFLDASIEGFNFGVTLTDLVLQVLVPVVAGLMLHRFLGTWAIRNKQWFSRFDKLVIWSIVYDSFSTSFSKGIFKEIPGWTLLVLSGVVVVLFFVVYALSGRVSHWLKFSREDQITVVYCGSKKSLVHGSVFASVLFAGSITGSLYLVPVMIYHAFQLFYISLVARKAGKENR